MKHTYETFTEIAEDFTDGSSTTHVLSEHSPEECIGWQHGVSEFAKFLDGSGIKIIVNPEILEDLWKANRDKLSPKTVTQRVDALLT